MTADKEISRGDSRAYDFFASLPQATPDSPIQAIDLTGSVVVFTMKRKRDDGGSVSADAPVIRKTSDDSSEIEIADQTTDEGVGHGSVLLVPSDTRFLDPGVYVYDIRVHLGGQAMTIARGDIVVDGDVGSAEDSTTP